MALLRVTLSVLCAAMLISTIPPLRGVFDAMTNTLVTAIEVSRSTDANRVAIARYALQYGITYDMATLIQATAREEGIDPDLAFRLVDVESEFDEAAVSSVGALGLTQLMPATADYLQPGITREQILERETNLRLGFRYLGSLLRTYDGHVEEALHAYNRGPGTVARIRAEGGDPANGFADRVLGTHGPEAYRGDGYLGTQTATLGAPR